MSYGVGVKKTKMPLVISQKAKRTFYVKNEESLGEILGHSNFDGEDWAVGDTVVFENGTSAIVEKHDRFHVWSEPRPIELRDGLALIRHYGDPRIVPDDQIDSWATLFEKLSVPLPKKSWRQSIFSK